MSKPVLGYWDIRGFAQQHRLLLTYLGVDFEDKRYFYGSGADAKKSWFDEKYNLGLNFPNLPYWIEGDVKIAESKAILKYLAKTRRPALVPETPELQAEVDAVEGVANDLQSALVKVTYSPTGIPETPLEEALAEKFKQVEDYFSTRQWTLGDNISYVDFFLYEVLKQFTKYNGDFLTPYPVLTSYVQKFEALPELADYVKSSEGLVCYSPIATLQY